MRGGKILPVHGEDFGLSAVRLAGLCSVLFGWSPDQFWRATPAEVRTVVEALAPQADVPVTRGMIEQLETCCG
ncbi:MAG: phage tail assembly chaperone [Sphingomonas bacterium]|uniref:phage tail assembly chaperone n=1 Tax=Sphingomonas bacterium TaxID=1895847 RepID=UPI0026272046|nr:phage tail assembly chaperone [Sphingomonas bacterium]MDB5696059.1 phage tail assembly chaperone [Sphingomonas bacterium]